MTGREVHFTEAHDHLHGPMFFKLLPPSRFTSPPANTALQVQQAKQILQAKKVLQAGIKLDEVGRQGETGVQVSLGECRLQQQTEKGGQHKGNVEGIQPNLQAHVEPLKSSTLALQKGEKKYKAEPRRHSKGGPVEKKHILLSTGRSVSITVNPSLTNSMTSQSSKQSIQGSGEDAKKVAALEESLKYDNYYNFAAGGVCAVATTKEAWEYQEEPGQRRLELSLGAQFNKFPKELEFYNSTTARGQEDKQLTPAAPSRAARNPPSVPKPVAGSTAQSLALRANESRVAISTPTTTKTQTKGGVFVNVRKMDSVLLAESESSKPGETSGSESISNGSEVPSTLETVVPKTTASTATSLSVQEPLNDLSTADPTPASVATGSKTAATLSVQEPLNDLSAAGPSPTGSEAAASETVQVKCVTTVNQIEIKKDAEKGPDTWSDELIAQLLQLHEEELRGQSHSSGHLRGAGGLGEAEGMVTDGSGLSFEDYELARQMQEEFDEELALEMEEEQSRARRYNSPYDERADRRNTPSTYSYYPTVTTPDNNAESSFRNRTFGRRPRGHYRREEQVGRRDMGEEWYRGLGTVVARRVDPPHVRLRGEMDMSYESLSQLQDVSRGLSMATISRLTNVYKFVPKQADSGDSADKPKPEDAKCCICLQAFVEGQQLRSLPCIHAFHRYCIDKWLSENKHCPVCMKDVLDFAVKFVDKFSSSSS